MKQSTKILIAGGAAWAVWHFVLRYTVMLEKLSFAFNGFQIHKLNKTGAVVRLYFLVSNKSRVGGPVKGFSGLLYLNETPLSTVYVPSFYIQPQAVSGFYVTAEVPYTKISNNLAYVIQNGGNVGEVRLVGDFKISAFNIPIDYTVNVTDSLTQRTDGDAIDVTTT